MVIALRTNLQVALQLVAVQLRIAYFAFDPHAFGHGARAIFGADARRHQFLEPTHAAMISVTTSNGQRPDKRLLFNSLLDPGY
jgi:hypothetical protein